MEAFAPARASSTAPLIGFAGAPFTLATYAVEGKTGKQFADTKRSSTSAPTRRRLLR